MSDILLFVHFDVIFLFYSYNFWPPARDDVSMMQLANKTYWLIVVLLRIPFFFCTLVRWILIIFYSRSVNCSTAIWQDEFSDIKYISYSVGTLSIVDWPKTIVGYYMLYKSLYRNHTFVKSVGRHAVDFQQKPNPMASLYFFFILLLYL